MSVPFKRIQEYLNKIAAHPGTVDISTSPHDVFWNVSRNEFISGDVPNVKCPRTGGGADAIPILKSGDSANSALLKVLTANKAVCNKRQMPGGGPFITDPGYSITLDDGTQVSGSEIQKDIQDWIDASALQFERDGTGGRWSRQ